MQSSMDSTVDTTVAAKWSHPSHLEINAFGFWIYLMSDLVIFAALFATFFVIGRNAAGGPGPGQLFDLPYLFIETMLLLFSSVTYGFAMVALNRKQLKMVLSGLVLAFLLGLGFVLMEIHEFHGMIMAGNGPARSGFLSAFFTLVGTHGTHVTFGLIWMAVMMAQLFKKGMTSAVRSRLARLGLFWHFLDIVWVGVFTIVYLSGVI